MLKLPAPTEGLELCCQLEGLAEGQKGWGKRQAGELHPQCRWHPVRELPVPPAWTQRGTQEPLRARAEGQFLPQGQHVGVETRASHGDTVTCSSQTEWLQTVGSPKSHDHSSCRHKQPHKQGNPGKCYFSLAKFTSLRVSLPQSSCPLTTVMFTSDVTEGRWGIEPQGGVSGSAAQACLRGCTDRIN